MTTIGNFLTNPNSWLVLFLFLSGLGLLLLAVNFRSHLQKAINWIGENYVYIILPLGLFGITLAIYFWVWDIRSEIGSIISLLNKEILLTSPSAENIRNLAYAIGALLAAVGISASIPFQLIKVWVNERLAKTTEQGHMTDRITKAVEQLGAEKTVKIHRTSKDGKKLYEDDLNGDPDYKKPIITETTAPNLEVRLGAIYALERIAQDSMRDHISVMEILCAYVRNNAPAEIAKGLEGDYKNSNWRYEQENALKAIPTPPTDIQTILTVIGRRKAKHISFERDVKANSIALPFQLDLRNTNLQKLDLSHLNFANALLETAKLQGAYLIGTNLHKADLRSANMQGASLTGADLQEVRAGRSNLFGAKFSFAKMQKADFYQANMQRIELTYTKAQGADLRKVEMEGAILLDTQFRGVDFTEALFDKNTDFRGAILVLANPQLVNFSEVTSLSENQLKSMFGDSTAILPQGATPPDWATWEVDRREFHEKWTAAKSAADL